MANVARSVLVNVGLVVGGAGLGAQFGGVVLGMLGFFLHPLREVPPSWQAQWMAMLIGAIVGGMLGPLARFRRAGSPTNSTPTR